MSNSGGFIKIPKDEEEERMRKVASSLRKDARMLERSDRWKR